MAAGAVFEDNTYSFEFRLPTGRITRSQCNFGSADILDETQISGESE
ncbi:MAG TPA: hypothetical protein VNH83_01760 [Bryobacteraceae bacterium]|nr:hypothetical protein [Bryobacteraceae bacterium]